MTEPAGSAVDDPTPPPSIGLALSGGGVRATLYSLGVVIALIETGANVWVRSIASVSGGSLLNAWLAHARDFSTLQSPSEFEAGKLARMLSRGGVFAWSPLNLGRVIVSAVGKIPTLLGIVLGLAGAMGAVFDNKRERPAFVDASVQYVVWRVGMVPPLIWLYIGISVAVFLLFVLRGRWQEAVFAVKLGELTGNNARCKCGEFTESKVQHVLVSTDLNSGCPVYFSKDFVHCRPHGWSEPGPLRTATALYASAAFPVVFPPRRLKLKDYPFRNGKAGPLADMALADGGVYNNLGDDWFNVRARQANRCWPYGRLTVDKAVREPLTTRIVVNAGAPSQALKRLWVGMATLRTMSVLYDNTVRPRVKRISGPHKLLLDIRLSPPQLARDTKRFSGPQAERARQIEKQLRKRERVFWAQLKREAAGTPTKLSGAGWRTAAALMHHGYLSAMVLLWAEYGESLPRLKDLRLEDGSWRGSPDDPLRLRDEKYFLDLAQGKVDTESKKPAKTPVAGEGVAVATPVKAG